MALLVVAAVRGASQGALAQGDTAQTGGPSIYTSEQATRGEATFAAACASCHGADLAGINDAPALVGPSFLNAWGRQRASDLLGFVSQSMPPSSPGSLEPDVALDVLAYILKANGARAGAAALTATTGTRVETVAGQVRPGTGTSGR